MRSVGGHTRSRRDMTEHAVDELRRLVTGVRARQLDGLVDHDGDRRRLHVQQFERAEAQHRALHLAEIDERPVLHRRPERGVDGVEMIDAADDDRSRECADVGGGPQILALVAQREVRVLRRALDLEEHAQRQLTTATPASRA